VSARRRGAWILPIVLGVALSGCANDGAPRAGNDTLPDGDPSAGPATSWVLAAEPRYSLTEAPTDPALPFVSLLEGVILDDGSTMIRDGPTTLVYLNSDGSAARIAGAAGGGPGEFQSLRSILEAPEGSGVWTWDRQSRRVSYFDRAGVYVKSFVPVGPTTTQPVGVLPGPAFVTVAEPEDGSVAGDKRRMYVLRDSQWTVVRQIRGSLEPASPELAWKASGITHHSQLHVGCVPQIGQVVVASELIAADAASGVIHAYGADGSEREVYRAAERQSFSDEIRAALESRLERRMSIPGREASAGVRRALVDEVRSRLKEQGDLLPAWQRVLADPDGRIWLQRSVCPLGGGDEVFDVVGVDGRLLGSVRIPDGMTVLAVRGEDVLVRRLGELDIQHVEMYRLIEERTPRGS
jgi:hypothetical protein